MRRGPCLFVILAISITPRVKSAEVMPPLAGETLDGQHIRLPSDITGPVAILIAGFTRKAAEQAEKWGMAAGKLRACGGKTIEWYEMPVISGIPRLIRPLVIRAIRSELAPELRSHFIPIQTEEALWKAALSFSFRDDAYVAIVGRDGTVKFRMHGAVDALKLSQVSEQLGAACNEKHLP